MNDIVKQYLIAISIALIFLIAGLYLGPQAKEDPALVYTFCFTISFIALIFPGIVASASLD